MVRATDKLRRLQKVAQGGKLSNEAARDSFLDLAVYALIGLVLYEEGVDKSVVDELVPEDVCGCGCKGCASNRHCCDQRCFPLNG